MVTNKQKLNITSYNANSLLDDIYEFYDFLTANNVDVCCVQETCFDETTIIPANSNYRWYILNRYATNSNQRRAGGVAIVVKRNLTHKVISAPSTKLLEVIGLQLATNRGNIEIFSAYLPGGATRTDIDSYYKSDLRLLTQRTSSVFIFGDLNSKHRSWNCVRANRAGNILFTEQQRQNFIVFFPSTTYSYSLRR